MQARTIDNISPLDYGAVADGETDSSASLALALAAAAGGTLTIRGRYLSTASLTVPPNTTVTGDGELIFSGGHALILSSGCTLDGLTISGGTPTDNSAIQVIGQSNVTIRGVTVTSPGKAGIYIIGSSTVTVEGWLVTDAPHAAIALHSSTAVKIGRGTLSGGSNQGVFIAGACTDVIIDRVHCLASSGGHAGIGLQGYGGTELPGNPVSTPSDRITVSNCVVEDYGLLGIEFWGGSTNVSISNCIIRRSTQWGFGLSLDSVIGVTVSNVTAINCTYGIENAASSNAVYSNIRGLGCATTLSLTGTSAPTLTGANGTGVVVTGLLCQSATESSIGTINTTSRIRVSNVVVRDFAGGLMIRILNATDVEIRGASLEANFSGADNHNFVVADGSHVLIDDFSLRATGSIPSVSLQAYQNGVLTIGRVHAHDNAFNVVASATADGVSDIRSLNGDSGFGGYGMDLPLSKGAGGGATSSAINGIGSSTRTIYDSGANRYIRFKVKKTTNFLPILHVIRWAGTVDGQVQRGGVITLGFWGGTVIKDPAVGFIGSAPAWTSYITDTDGYPCWDIHFPVTGGITATIDSMGLGVTGDDWLIYRVSDTASTGTVNQMATGSGMAVMATTPTLVNPTATTSVTIDGAPGNWRYVGFKTAGVSRFDVGIDVAGESGGNAGSDFFVHRFADDGSFIDSPVIVSRATGSATFASALYAPTASASSNTTQVATTAHVQSAITARAAVANGLATLDSAGKLLTNQLPALAITDTWTVASQAAMLALSAQRGDVAVRTDVSEAYILAADDPTVLANWVQLPHPAAPVLSVFGRTGAVASAAGDYAAAMITNTAAGGITSVTVQAALNELDTKKAPLASPALTGTPTAPTAAVDTNTTQVATTAFVLAQAGAATPAMDGTAAVGSSTRYARADHVHPTDTSRAPLASPALTGTPTAPTAAVDTSTTQLATTAFVLAQAGTATPGMDGTAAAGSSTRYARADHVHPTDTSRAPLASPTFTGTVTTAALTATGLIRGYLGVAGGNQNFAVLTPTDYAVGKPQLYFKTDSVATNWRIGLWDGASNAGTLYLDAGTVAVGVITASTAAVDTNTTQVATTAFVLAQAGAATPGMDGTAAVGSSTRYARADHVHPTDTSRLAAANNLSDLGSAATARTNLGLGSIATQAASAVAITGGTVDGVVIGGTNPAAATVTALTLTAAPSSSVPALAMGAGAGLYLVNNNGNIKLAAGVNASTGKGGVAALVAGSATIAGQTGGTINITPGSGNGAANGAANILDAAGNARVAVLDSAITLAGTVTVNSVTAFDASGIVGLRSYTVATQPSAATAQRMIYVSDESGGPVPAFSDGTNWRRVTDRAVVS
ncbi:right-handed parallel beta-helix repeat-containing protein [Azospirillum sp. B4]|uniref:right-handed parallel beta-helix repeat-containing protein n=1 Tax=Azospirillum sp. B4 TaxID=95605 RepID=UPI0003454E64|nr:right-handed parallel beta-helix repeat-containing protein [Azospirillum sp. B4]